MSTVGPMSERALDDGMGGFLRRIALELAADARRR